LTAAPHAKTRKSVRVPPQADNIGGGVRLSENKKESHRRRQRDRYIEAPASLSRRAPFPTFRGDLPCGLSSSSATAVSNKYISSPKGCMVCYSFPQLMRHLCSDFLYSVSPYHMQWDSVTANNAKGKRSRLHRGGISSHARSSAQTLQGGRSEFIRENYNHLVECKSIPGSI